MSDQVLRDKMGKHLGTIKSRPDGKLELRDHFSKLKGTYDPKTNTTRDHLSRSVGKGNLLVSLL